MHPQTVAAFEDELQKIAFSEGMNRSLLESAESKGFEKVKNPKFSQQIIRSPEARVRRVADLADRAGVRRAMSGSPWRMRMSAASVTNQTSDALSRLGSARAARMLSRV